MRRLFLLLLCALPLAFAACDSSPTEARVEDAQFAAGLGVDLDAMTRTNGGLYYRDLTVGTGAVAQNGTQVSVFYRGWLTNGTLFDSNVGKAPLPFRIGDRRMIAGFEEGATGMKVGGKRQIVIPPSLGYGQQRVGIIPPNSILVFELDLLTAE
jgi:FKBP-type peptidyl-prolyl cis-trans isomerase FkpA